MDESTNLKTLEMFKFNEKKEKLVLTKALTTSKKSETLDLSNF